MPVGKSVSVKGQDGVECAYGGDEEGEGDGLGGARHVEGGLRASVGCVATRWWVERRVMWMD